MRSSVAGVCAVAAGLASVALLCFSSPAVAAPSARLSAALDKKLPDVSDQNTTLHQQLQAVHFRALESGVADFRIGIEYDDSQPVTCGNLSLRNATMREQLDAIADGAGYAWQADGDWINLIPKAKLGDPKWVLNEVMQGTIVVSRDASVATPVKDWFAQREIRGVREIRGPRVPGAKAAATDPIVLHNPTLREYINARERSFGNNVWCNRVRLILAEDDQAAQHIVLISWGQNTKALAEGWTKPEPTPTPAASPKP